MNRDPTQNPLWHRICALLGVPVTTSLDVVHRRLAGVGRGTLQRIRDGVTGTRLDSLTKIADALQVPVSELVSPTISGRSAQTQEPSPRWQARATIGLEQALNLLLDAVAVLPPARWASIKAQLDQAALNPTMRHEIVQELLLLMNSPHEKLRSATR